MSQPLICPFSGETMSTVAPAALSRSRGTSSSDCSKPWVARIMIFFPESFMAYAPEPNDPCRQPMRDARSDFWLMRSAMDVKLAEIPVRDVRDGGPLRHAIEA